MFNNNIAIEHIIENIPMITDDVTSILVFYNEAKDGYIVKYKYNYKDIIRFTNGGYKCFIHIEDDSIIQKYQMVRYGENKSIEHLLKDLENNIK